MADIAEESKSSSYKGYHQRYYQKHKEEIKAREQEKKRWLRYYEEHREEIKAKAKARYEAKKAQAAAVGT